MLDPELAARLDDIAAKADAAARSAEAARKYLLWTGIITAALIILPLIGLIFVIPSFLSSYTAALGGTGVL
jgi:hypothetical protein